MIEHQKHKTLFYGMKINKLQVQTNYNNSFNYTDLSRFADHRLFTVSKQCHRSLIGSKTKFYLILFSAEQFRSRFEGKTYHKITIGLNLFVDNSLKDFETFWRKEEWKLVSLVFERFFTYIFFFSFLISFLVFAATVR